MNKNSDSMNGFRVLKDVMVSMTDGTGLATDVWIPNGGPAPTLVVRLPYGKDVIQNYAVGIYPGVFDLLEAGYAVVYQDCRGRYRSDGEFAAFVDEKSDGLDTTNWVTEQPWCDGNVGGFGASYLGATQWATASQSPASLKAIAPSVASADQYRAPIHSDGGALSWHLVLWWGITMAVTKAQNDLVNGDGNLDTITALATMAADPKSGLSKLPTSDQQILTDYIPWWREFLDHADRDDYWQSISVSDDYGTVTAPALNVGGWFDIFASANTRAYTRMKTAGGSSEAREGQRLIMGPWDHLSYDGVYHDRQFGITASAAASNLPSAYIGFFDRWLRGNQNAPAPFAPVRIFVMGIDQWRDEQDWPLPDTRYVEYFLSSGGHANTAAGNGRLDTVPVSADLSDTFTYDPLDPVPSVGGRLLLPVALNAAGPVDQQSVEARDDVLCYTTGVLDKPVEVTGEISLVLHIASSAVDTDFTGKLVDVFPDGRAIYLTDGILRTRYRTSLSDPEMLEPGQVYEVTLDLSVTSNVFLPGHQIRLEVSSSNFPRYDRNTNSGGVISQDSAENIVVATNRVLHGPKHPSRMILPIIER
ncbi:CocE/NonD family hydrolase [Rhodococcus sp. 14-2483-1-2]|uniref:CocE/NonD family hydrolase n=1 Tax=Rhodococcus sp. 14-2483-1-2 TaxID=2023147 RepID=UPI00207B16CE|nr:CocE/NonD family hydrolase [Rhodococcus sp. 14-2483-1-2]